MTSNIRDRVISIITDHLGKDASEIKDESQFMGDLGADSLDTVELVMAFEEEFDIEIPEEEAIKIQTVQDAVKQIESHLANLD